MAAHLEQIRRWNPRLNAIVAKLDDDSCLALADAADARIARGEPPGALHGLPWAFKDLEPAVGFPAPGARRSFATGGRGRLGIGRRLRRAGALPIGKTNTSEFGMGSNSYNGVYGTTRNPYDATRCAGGSSGGAAAGSPAACCRPRTAATWRLAAQPRQLQQCRRLPADRGTRADGAGPLPLLGFAVQRPHSRSVPDTAYLLAGNGGPRRAGPASCAPGIRRFSRRPRAGFEGVRVAGAGSRRPAARSRASAPSSKRSGALRGDRLHRRGCHPDLSRRGRGVPDVARFSDLDQFGAVARRASRRVQARSRS